ncbi:hypothetical protein [Winogradskyella ouciana]|uniref:hypothetical protein n=1 Tax=Winogradskyella ouciana TaxID=2608631 RepID=UPI003D28AA47
MNKRQIIMLVAIALIISGTILMIALKDNAYNYLIGGGLIGGGFGLIPALYSTKGKK